MAKRMRVRFSEPDTDFNHEHEDVREQAREYANLKHEERGIESRRKEVGGVLLPLMKKLGYAKQLVDFNEDTNAVVQVKTREHTKIDADRLKKALGATAYNKLTSAFLDEAKVEAAIKLGEVDPNVVASCTESSETPYLEVRFTKKRKRNK